MRNHKHFLIAHVGPLSLCVCIEVNYFPMTMKNFYFCTAHQPVGSNQEQSPRWEKNNIIFHLIERDGFLFTLQLRDFIITFRLSETSAVLFSDGNHPDMDGDYEASIKGKVLKVLSSWKPCVNFSIKILLFSLIKY